MASICKYDHHRGKHHHSQLAVQITIRFSFNFPQIHELLDDDRNKTLFESKSAFRLIYNGKILTGQVPGCSLDLELCDVKFLIGRVEPIAVRKVDCGISAAERRVNATRIDKPLFSTTWGILSAILAIGMGAFAGATIVTYKLTGTLPAENLKRRRNLKPKKKYHPSVAEQIEMSAGADASPAFEDPHEGPEPVLT